MRSCQRITPIGICAMLGLSGCVYTSVDRTEDSNGEMPSTSVEAKSTFTDYFDEEENGKTCLLAH